MASRGHIVCIPFPSQGHVTPMIHFARKVALNGFVVTLINIPSIEESILQTWKHVAGQDIRFESIPMVLDNILDNNSNNDVGSYLDAIVALEEPLAQLLSDITKRGPQVSCVISDYYHFSCPYAARKAQLPSVCWWPGLVAWACIEFHVSQLITSGDFPVKEVDKLVAYPLPGLHPIKAAYLPLDFQEQTANRLGMKRICYRTNRVQVKESWVLVNSLYELEPEVFDAIRGALTAVQFLPIGPLFPFKSINNGIPHANLRMEDEECFQWLDRQQPKSVLYISFGSLAALTEHEFKALAGGLRASNQPFIWVVHAQSVIDKPADFYKDVVAGMQQQGLIISWAAQTKVLEHNSTGGFLTHCGWNSVFESISAAVPMLGWPCLYDQSTNCKLVLEEKGIGIRIYTAENSEMFEHEVETKIRALMTGDEGKVSRKKVEELQLMVESAARGGSSHKNFEAFLSAVEDQLIY